MLEVCIRQPSQDCPCYTWDREQAHPTFNGDLSAQAEEKLAPVIQRAIHLVQSVEALVQGEPDVIQVWQAADEIQDQEENGCRDEGRGTSYELAPPGKSPGADDVSG